MRCIIDALRGISNLWQVKTVVPAQAAPANREAWWRLGRCRAELEQARAAVVPLTHALRGWPTHPGNEAVWRTLVQVALAAGQTAVAAEALQRWEEAVGGGAPDAALALGAGGRMPATELERLLQVCRGHAAFLCCWWQEMPATL